jgi:hypothetical protein
MAAAPSTGLPKKKQVVKCQAQPSVAPEMTTIDPQAGDHIVEHNVFDNISQRYKTKLLAFFLLQLGLVDVMNR